MSRKSKTPAEDEPRQYTRIRMRPIGDLRAEALALYCAPQDIETHGRDALIELLCGIAAIENPMRRQEVAQQAVLRVYELNNEHIETVARYVEEVIGEEGVAL
jgi:hypothetical protein